MYPESKSSWSRLSCNFHRPSRQEKVLERMTHRENEGACLDEMLVETYVRHNCSDGEVDELFSTSRFWYAVRARPAQAATGVNNSNAGDQKPSPPGLSNSEVARQLYLASNLEATAGSCLDGRRGHRSQTSGSHGEPESL